MSIPAQTKRPPDRRRQILDVAARLFAERGFAATSVADLADAVGVTGGAIYRHFASKDDLLETIVVGMATAFAALADGDPQGGSPVDHLTLALSGAVDLILSEPDAVATYLAERPRLPDPIAAELHPRERRFADLWRRLLISANPALTRADGAVRLAALNGISTALATRPDAVQRPRLDQLGLAGAMAVVLAPPSARDHVDPRPPSTWSAPILKRQRVRAAAAASIRRRGFHAVGIDEIGEAAGIAGPNLYRTFANKDAILIDICDYTLARIEASTQRALARSTSPAQALSTVFGSYAALAYEMPDFVVVISVESRSLPPAAQARVAGYIGDQRHALALVLQQLRPDLTEAEATVLIESAVWLVERIAAGRRGDLPGVASTVDLVAALLGVELPPFDPAHVG